MWEGRETATREILWLQRKHTWSTNHKWKWWYISLPNVRIQTIFYNTSKQYGKKSRFSFKIACNCNRFPVWIMFHVRLMVMLKRKLKTPTNYLGYDLKVQMMRLLQRYSKKFANPIQSDDHCRNRNNQQMNDVAFGVC